MSRKVWIALAAVAVLFVAAYLGSPFWAARQFREAALSTDVDRIDAAVDFPAVRESLKAQMTAAAMARMRDDREMRSNPFAGLGAMLMPVLVDRVVDGLVTPDGIATLVKRGAAGKGSEARPRPDLDYDYDYRSLDRFAVIVRAPGSKPGGAPGFVFERRGLFSWKMIRLEIPESVLSGGGARPS